MIAVLAFTATVWILTMYVWMVRTGDKPPFNLANAVGCFPILLSEVVVGAWPAFVLTAAFGIIGWWGLLRG